MLSTSEWVSEWVRDVCHTNQIGCIVNTQSISCCKGKWYVRRFWSQYHSEWPYLFFYKRRESHILGLLQRFLWVRVRILWAGLIVVRNLIISQRNIVFGIWLQACDEGWAFPIRFWTEWVLAAQPLGLRCEWRKHWFGFYDRNNYCILGGRNALLGIWRGCDQVQIVCVLYWNPNINCCRVCNECSGCVVNFSIHWELSMWKAKRLRLISSTDQKYISYSVTILQLEWFLFTTGMTRYVLNETKSFLFNVIRVFAFFTLIASMNCSRRKGNYFCSR